MARSKRRAKDQLVSVAMTTCNGERFLREQLESILQQSHRNIEVVAVDDGSEDGTLDLLERYRSRRKLRYVLNKRRLGFVKNFEKAVSACKGDLIALADQDDVWLPHKIEVLVREIGERDLACSDLTVIDEGGKTIAASLRQFQGITIPPEGDQFRFLVWRNFVTGSAALFRRHIVTRALPFPDTVLPHDWWLALHASIAGGIRYLDNPLTLYRQHSHNVIGARHQPTIWKLLIFALSAEQRNRAYAQDRERFNLLLDRNVFLDEAGKEYLKDMIRYCDSHLATKVHFDSLRISYKYRSVMLAGISPFWRPFFLLRKLVG